MYAVFIHGGKQHRVKEGQIIKLEKIDIETGKQIIFDQILMIVKNKKITIGNPILKKCSILANVNDHGRNKKIKIIKFHRRKHHKKQQGHRQDFTEVKIKKINNHINY
ncbi:MAG TPA: 50S ribosomal protein L21 [Buchnera sp. (in: enterobacteria)]|nr:50S ribosomal protein L21 [Buchnera sp. (in: enterobacteria)]